MDSKKTRSRFFLPFLSVVFLFGLSGCVYFSEKINVAYQPIVRTESVPALPLNVSIQVMDNRREGNQVSCKKGEHGIELASIKLKGSLADEIKAAVRLELQSLGCSVGYGNAIVEIEIQKFYNEFKPGYFKGRGVAELILGVNLKKKDGEIVYSKTLMGIGENNSVWFQTGNNAKKALEGALCDAIHKLINDQAFMQALKKEASKSPRAQVTSTPAAVPVTPVAPLEAR